jgi:hypothetical protein
MDELDRQADALGATPLVDQARRVGRDDAAYRLVFEFWLKIFGVAFGLGVVSGIVMGFQFGSNWSVLARMASAPAAKAPASSVPCMPSTRSCPLVRIASVKPSSVSPAMP